MSKTPQYTDKTDSPLVSVIIRTKDSPDLLREALTSVAKQTYPYLDVIVVNDGGVDISSVIKPFKDSFPHIRQIHIKTNVGRAEAANIGLQSAQGDFIIFLDQDDLFDPDHIEYLLKALQQNTHAGAAYSGVRVLEADDTEHFIFNEPYDSVKLRMEAYIPIHSVLFRRSLLDKGIAFDSALDVYEDWDFWLQLSELTEFIHVDRFSATYRAIGTSGVGAGTFDKTKKADAHKALLAKWLARWTPEQMYQILERYQQAKQRVQRIQQDFKVLAEERQRIQKEYDKLSQSHIQLVDMHNQLGQKYHQQGQKLHEKQNQLNETIKKLETLRQRWKNETNLLRDQLSQTETRLRDVMEQLNEIQNSTFWKLTWPGRYLVTKLKKLIGQS